MNEKISRLKALGCDTDDALRRLDGDEAFYLDCIQDFLGGTELADLRICLEKGDAPGGFALAHTLKGVAANLSLSPLLTEICAMVEPLRAGVCTGMAEHLTRAEALVTAIADCMAVQGDE